MLWEALFWTGLAIVFISYVGYGMWVAWLARLRPVATRTQYLPEDELPTVTCVMAVGNEAQTIERKLRALERQDYPRQKLRIIVVSDASTDSTDAIVTGWAARDDRIQLLRTARRDGKPTALNLARPCIQTEIAVFMDARQDLTPGAVRELVAHLADPEVGIVSGDYRVAGDSYWAYERFVRQRESRSGSMVQVTGSLYAIRTRDVPQIPPSTILDDMYVPLQVALSGRRIVMAEKAGSLDVATRSIGNEFIRKVRTLAGLVQICHIVDGCLNPGRNPVWARFVLHKLSRLACPYALLMMLVGSCMARGWAYSAAFAAAAGLGLMALGASIGIRSRLTALSQAFLALNLAAFWALPRYYLGRASVTWTRVETDRL
jgi:biofilm PGA synthesis N-glycosyltransferase PgaC